jgi:hypothetical protein
MTSETEFSTISSVFQEKRNDGPKSEVGRGASADHFEVAMISDANESFRVVVDLGMAVTAASSGFEKNRSWGFCLASDLNGAIFLPGAV